MEAISKFADRQPFLLSLAILMIWLVLVTALVFACASLLQLPFTDLVVQSLGTLLGTCILLFLIYRLGWIRWIGLITLGGWRVWGLTLLLGVYVVLSGFYGFFGEVTFDLRQVVATQEARAIVFRQPIVGFVEETLFRGILLYTLVRAWGKNERGLLAAVIVQAGLFGVFHGLQSLAGMSPLAVLSNVFSTFVFGIWSGILVLLMRTLWPSIVLHAISNAFVTIKGLHTAWIEPAHLGYLQAMLYEIPLVILGLGLLLRVWQASGEGILRDKGLTSEV